MKSKLRNPAAFPLLDDTIRNEGMTLRDYFAGKVITSSFLNVSKDSQLELVKRAYNIADEMLKEREL